MQANNINLIIADDHMLVLEALGYALEKQQFNVLAKAHSGREALRLVKELQPNVLLLDLMLPDKNGHQVLSELKNHELNTRVIILSSSKDPADVVQAIDNGAAGYITKDMHPHELSEAILTVASGGKVFEHEVLDKAMSMDVAGANESDHGLIDPLTSQELRVLMLISSGMSNPEVASILSISPNTIKTHVRSIFQKLGVSDRTSAALWAAHMGLLPQNAPDKGYYATGS